MADGDKTFTQADIDKITAAADQRIEAMNAKVEEALGEAKKAKAEARKLKEIDPADMQRLEDENTALKDELSKAQRLAKDAKAEAEKAAKALEGEMGFTQKLLIQDGLKSALIANGVKDEDFIDTLAAKFATSASVSIEGDARVAKIGDKTVADAVKEWAGTDAGKKFIAAPHNSGGGAPGGGAGSGGKTITQEQHDSMKPKDRAAFFAEGGKITSAA